MEGVVCVCVCVGGGLCKLATNPHPFASKSRFPPALFPVCVTRLHT